MPVIQVGDLRTYYREWGAPRPERPPIVLVHGNWSTHRWWIPVAASLPDRWLIAPDLRGRGDTRGDDHGYTLPELAADVLGVLDGLGIERAHLVGHSLGAGVVMQAALDRPERVASLIAIAPVWVDGMPERWARAELHAADIELEPFAAMLAAVAPEARRGRLWQTLVTTGHRQRAAATTRNRDALARWRPGDALSALAMPRLVIDGERDRLAGGATAERAAQALGCVRVCLPGIGHSPPLEAPERVAALIGELVDTGGVSAE